MRPKIYYAIGDIHGELSRLKLLHSSISDYHNVFHPNCDSVLIHLGDYIDRGPDSYGVVEYLMSLGTKAINLKGNHEALMLDAFLLGKPSAYNYWVENGGAATLESYRARGLAQPPKHHLDWMANLPTRYIDQRRKLVFVHAGIDPDTFPDGDERVHMWTRSPHFFDTGKWLNPALSGFRVVHGHTPTENSRPFVSTDGRRINVDTGAVFDGQLSSVIISETSCLDFIAA